MKNNSIFNDLNNDLNYDPVINKFGGIQSFSQKLQNFAQEFSKQNLDPRTKVQEMLNSGQMTQSQFDQFRAIANKITGKNL